VNTTDDVAAVECAGVLILSNNIGNLEEKKKGIPNIISY
jgi:hypothetical protein